MSFGEEKFQFSCWKFCLADGSFIVVVDDRFCEVLVKCLAETSTHQKQILLIASFYIGYIICCVFGIFKQVKLGTSGDSHL